MDLTTYSESELIELVKMARAELAKVNVHLDRVFADCEAEKQAQEVARLRALIAKHLPAMRFVREVQKAMAPMLMNREVLMDAVKDFEREVQ